MMRFKLDVGDEVRLLVETITRGFVRELAERGVREHLAEARTSNRSMVATELMSKWQELGWFGGYKVT